MKMASSRDLFHPKEQIDQIGFGEGLTQYITVAEWAKATLGWSEAGWAAVYLLLMIGNPVFPFEASRRFLRDRLADVLRRNTDELVYDSARA
jgi:hypothetical protein